MLPNIFPWILPWWIYFTCLKMTSYLRPYMDAMGRRSEKITAILWTKYFFDAASSCFCRHEILFCATSTFFLMTWNTFSCNINTFLSKPNYFLCNVKLFISTQNYFSCNTKFLFCSLCIMLCHGDIFLLSHSNKNIITSQKINKLSFLCDTKKINFVFCASPFFYIQFLHYILSACWSSS